ncbi:SDR family NAD(P)-dependent oxidoreductase [Haloglycomyces albus]|uniref:SDR family NAD(P)-dependent oxidoreductase n=1 Tax=Haloglycomyces albus TaxID=526067 RepID=UPI00046D8A54|nr:SDR family oxidoreductase [Haloglycomyces albus]
MTHIVVTGGGTGIGRAIAHAFAQKGNTVTIVGRRDDKLSEVSMELANINVNTIAADLTRTDGIDTLATSLHDRTIDVLINNAGGLVGGGGETRADRIASTRDMIELNLTSAVNVVDALWDNLARPGGRVINISSIAGQRGGGTYGAAKAGLIGHTSGLARKGGPAGITANTIAPGYIMDTEFFEAGRAPHHDTLIDETLLKRGGRPSDIASAAVFLASDGASFITGQTLAVNGGAYIHY